MKLVLLFVAVLMIAACSTVDPQSTLLNQVKSACKSGVEQFDNGTVSFSCFNKEVKRTEQK